MIKCTLGFPTPIWITELNVSDNHCLELIKFCKELKEKDCGNIKSNVGGWQSKYLYLKDNEFTPLVPYFLEVVSTIKKILLDLQTEEKFDLGNLWININNEGDYNTSHYHPTSILSGVFYLSDENSKIIFERERDTTHWMLDYIGSGNSNDITRRSIEFEPKKNSLLLFPSWVYHRVEKSNSKKERISIAFNLSFKNDKI